MKSELSEYGGFEDTQSLVVLSKTDLLGKGRLEAMMKTLPEGAMALSSATGSGVRTFLHTLAKMVRELRS